MALPLALTKWLTPGVPTYRTTAVRNKLRHPARRPGFQHAERGFQKLPGTHVQAGYIIVRQLTLDYHPGQFVGIGIDKTLYAMEPGYVILTTEQCKPDMSHQIAQEAYSARNKDVVFWKKYVHVLPDPLPEKFNLTSHE